MQEIDNRWRKFLTTKSFRDINKIKLRSIKKLLQQNIKPQN